MRCHLIAVFNYLAEAILHVVLCVYFMRHGDHSGVIV